MHRKIATSLLIIAFALSANAFADEVTQIVQKDLIALGYDPGNIQGEATTETIVAISKFQAENNLEVTGTATPQLAGIIKAKINTRNNPGRVASAQPAAPARDPAALQAAQQACLQEKITAAQASQKKKRGFGSLMRAVTNTAVRFGGNNSLAQQVQKTSYDIYRVDATADDWDRAAKDLGLTNEDLEQCQNP